MLRIIRQGAISFGLVHLPLAHAAHRLHRPHTVAWAQMAAERQSLPGPVQALGFKPVAPGAG